MLKSALLIFLGQTFGSLLGLVRNLLIARLISVENYGIAATFAITMSLIEMMTTLGLNQLIIQDKDGEDQHLQSGLQGFHLLRSVFSGTLLFAVAPVVARFLGTDDILWAYQLLGLMPMIGGLTHFDIYRLQRRMVYLPSILVAAIPPLVSLLLIWPLYQVYQDFRVMLYVLLAQSVAIVVTSHVFAQRPYRLRLDPQVMTRAFRFGWPLLINNILLFMIFESEKIIVGREVSLAALALFAMGMTLTLTPTQVLGSSSQSFFLPQLSAIRGDAERFKHVAITTFQAHLVLGSSFVIGVLFLGAPVVRVLLGEKYAALIPLMTWLAILQSLRLFKGGGTTVALAMARTGVATIANLARIASIPFAWYIASHHGDLVLVIWVSIIAELAGFLISLILVRRLLSLSLKRLLPSLWLTFGLLVVVAVDAWLNQHPSVAFDEAWTYPVILVLFLLSVATMGDLRRYVMHRKAVGSLL